MKQILWNFLLETNKSRGHFSNARSRVRDKVPRDAPCNGILPCARYVTPCSFFLYNRTRAFLCAQIESTLSLLGLSLPARSFRDAEHKKAIAYTRNKGEVIFFIYIAPVTTRASSATSIDFSSVIHFCLSLWENSTYLFYVSLYRFLLVKFTG